MNLDGGEQGLGVGLVGAENVEGEGLGVNLAYCCNGGLDAALVRDYGKHRTEDLARH